MTASSLRNSSMVLSLHPSSGHLPCGGTAGADERQVDGLTTKDSPSDKSSDVHFGQVYLFQQHSYQLFMSASSLGPLSYVRRWHKFFTQREILAVHVCVTEIFSCPKSKGKILLLVRVSCQHGQNFFEMTNVDYFLQFLTTLEKICQISWFYYQNKIYGNANEKPRNVLQTGSKTNISLLLWRQVKTLVSK